MTTETRRDKPAKWSEWPQSDKLDWITLSYTRGGLLALICNRAGIDRDVSNTGRLTVRELAAVALELGEVSQ